MNDMDNEIEQAISRNDLPQVVDLLEDSLISHPRPELSSRTELVNALILSAVKVKPNKVKGMIEKLLPSIDADSVVPALIDAGLRDEAKMILNLAPSTGPSEW